jgi:hypothetical protein
VSVPSCTLTADLYGFTALAGAEMQRAKATALLEGLLERVAGEATDDWPLGLVSSVDVFGSYMRGALEPGDVDIAVELNREDPQWRSHFLNSFSSGRDPYAVVRVALRGKKRGLSILCEPGDGHGDIEMIRLWSRGESLAVALERVRAIEVDSTAGRAPRDAMIPCLEGIEEWVPRYLREEIVDFVSRGYIEVEQVQLPGAEVDDPFVADEVDMRWGERSPLRRAAHSVLAHLEERDIDLYSVHLHGRDIENKQTPYYIGFRLRYLRGMVRCFEEYDGVEWIEIPHPSMRGAVIGLRFRRGPRFENVGDRPLVASFFS